MPEIPIAQSCAVHVALNTIVQLLGTRNKQVRKELLLSVKDNHVAKWFFDILTGPRLPTRVDPEDSRTYSGTAVPARMEERFIRIQEAVNSMRHKKPRKEINKNVVESIIQECSHEHNFMEGVLYTRLINRELNLSIPNTTICEVWPDFALRSTLPYAKSLVDRGSGELRPDVIQQITYPCVAEPRIGSVLASIIWSSKGSRVTGFGGQCLPALQGWADDMSDALKGTPDAVINGEFYIKNEDVDYSKTASLCRMGMGSPGSVDELTRQEIEDSLVFVAYDIFLVTALAGGAFNVPCGHSTCTDVMCRSEILASLVQKIATGRSPRTWESVHQTLCHSFADVELAHAHNLDNGYDGTIIKPCGTTLRLSGPSQGLFKWRRPPYRTGHILSVYSMHGAANVGLELLLSDLSIEHAKVPTQAMRNWFVENASRVIGFPVEYTYSKQGTFELPIVSRLRKDRKRLSDAAIQEAGSRLGCLSVPCGEPMRADEFSLAADRLVGGDQND